MKITAYRSDYGNIITNVFHENRTELHWSSETEFEIGDSFGKWWDYSTDYDSVKKKAIEETKNLITQYKSMLETYEKQLSKLESQ